MEPPSYSQVTSQEPSGRHAKLQRWWSSKRALLEPWLQMRARLFLCMFSPALISLLLVAVHVSAATHTADIQADDLKQQLIAACHEAERAASIMASVPYYFADNFNDATKRNIDDTVHGLAQVMMLSVTAIERLLVFLVDMYRSFYLCVIELIVRGSLAVIQAAVDALSGAIGDVAQSLKTTIQSSVNGINTSLRASLGGINDILKIVGKSVSVPQISMPNLSALDNVQLPASFDAGLTSLNNSLPTLSELKQQLNALIETPFEKMKTEINSTLTTYSFDRTNLPVPMSQNLTFCDANNVTSPINELSAGFHHAANIGLGILVLIAVLFVLVCLLLEWLHWRSLRRVAQQTHGAYRISDAEQRQSSNSFSERDVMSVLDLASHPFLAEKGLQCARRCGITSRDGLSRLRWWLAWISHPSLLAVLAMGIIGFISAQCQIWTIDVAVARGKEHAAGIAQANEDQVQNAVNSHLEAVSKDYADRSNAAIQAAQDDVNNHSLAWVATTTATMNDTLNEFENGIAEVLNSTFQNTPLFTPIQSFVGCILLNKVDEIEKGLTWIHDNAHVTFPVVPQDALMIGANATKALAQPAQDQIVGDGGPNSGIVNRLANTYLHGVELQRTLFLSIAAAYIVIAALGALIALLLKARDESCYNDTGSQEAMQDGKADGGGPDDGQTRPSQKSSHASISAPLLEDVVKLYYERQKQREEAQDVAARDFAARAVESRQRNVIKPAHEPYLHEQELDDGSWRQFDHPSAFPTEASHNSLLSTMSSLRDCRCVHESMQSLQAPSSRIASSGSGVNAHRRWRGGDILTNSPRQDDEVYSEEPPSTFAASSRAHLQAPDEVQLMRHAFSSSPSRPGVAM